MRYKNPKILLFLLVSSYTFFLVEVPAIPVQDVRLTENQAWLICTVTRTACPTHPIPPLAHNPGFASATYAIFGVGTGPQLHYPLTVGSYHDQITFVNEHTACLGLGSNLSSCVTG